MKISIVNYGMGNLGSIQNMFKKIGVSTEVISTVDEINKAEKILLPGVGAFDAAIERIDKLSFREPLTYKAKIEKVPVLGICLGMQLLTTSSEEGSLKGLGWIDAKTLSFKKVLDLQKFKVPHMGWNTVSIKNPSSLTNGLELLEDVRFYFVHSYYVQCKNENDSILKSTYGIEFDAAIQNDNIFGAQFHPEKSHKFGLKLLENFARL